MPARRCLTDNPAFFANLASATDHMTAESLTLPAAWQPALAHSAYLRRLLAAQPALAGELTGGAAEVPPPLTPAALAQFLAAGAINSEADLQARLRQLRQRVMATLIVRDLAGQAPLAEVTATISALADVGCNFALDFLHRQLAAQHGEPQDGSGEPLRLLVIGMGKQGGGELNVSSDLDLIFVYPEEGETAAAAGQRRIDNHDFFVRLGKRLIAALHASTADGQVFRIDMRLRPHGDAAPLACSLLSLENYFITQGREWERYAWIKARLLNSGANRQEKWAQALFATVRPFVFRKYLDFGAINAMRDLHAQIRREVARQDKRSDIKLGPGGIREIEFIAQVFQLIRGGRDSALQVRPTLAVLDLLAERAILPESAHAELSAAYVFLRRLEHRLQYVDDAQTHRLPESAEAQALIAGSMGFADWADFAAALRAQRDAVARHFEAVFSDPEAGGHPLAALWPGEGEADEAVERLGEIGFARPQDSAAALHNFCRTARYRQLPASNRERLDAVGPRLIQVAAASRNPDLTLQRGLDFLDAISRRGSYLAFLQQYPQALTKVADLVGSSRWAADYLNRHPLLLDEVLDPLLYETAIDWPGFSAALEERLAASAGDAEREMDILREAHHAQVFRILVQDLAGLHTLERVSDHLSQLADLIIGQVLRLVWPKIRQRHCATPQLAVIGYGKLGGKELGYASDLDLVFIYDDDHPAAAENYARLVQRMNTWLSMQTSAGQLFATDLRLRPNGDAGLLATPIDAFLRYQQNDAWVWEHQALTRARYVAGSPELGARFEALRETILRLPRQPADLAGEVLAMRQRLAKERGGGEPFDLKYGAGGLIDVEFIVQYLVLAHSRQHRSLVGNLGNIALLGSAADLRLIAAELAAPVQDAYRRYRRLQHAARLDGATRVRVAPESVQNERAAVSALWQAVFAAAPAGQASPAAATNSHATNL